MSHHHSSLIACLVALGVVAGCSASGAFSGDLDSTEPAPEGTAQLPPPSGGSSGSSGSSGGQPDGGKPKPPKNDSGVDAGPPPPEPGSVCAKIDEIFSKPCGACGKQEALCIKEEGAATGRVTEYSSCINELEGGCVPGTIVDESCGNCGTHKKTCTKYCAWTATACTGEPANSCAAGTVAWSSAGCATAGTFRERACGDTCKWGSFQACSSPDFSVNVLDAVGKVASVIVPISPAYRGKRVTGSCTSASGATVSTTDGHNVAWVRVVNPTDRVATVSVWNAQAPGGPVMNTVLVGYVTQPTNDDELKACEKGAGDYCSTATLPCGDSKFGALSGTNALVIPAGGSRVVAITTYSPHGAAGEITEGEVLLSVRADVLE